MSSVPSLPTATTSAEATETPENTPPAEAAPAVSVPSKKNIWLRAGWRYVTILGIMGVLWVLYHRHPYYLRAQFAPWRPVFDMGLTVWAVGGLFYCYATVKKFSTRAKDMRDGALLWMLLVRGAWRGKTSHLFRSRRVKTAILSLFVKLFYIPLMVTFFSGHSNNLARNWAFRKHQPVFGDASRVMHFEDWWAYVTTTVPKLVPDWSDISALFDAHWWNLGNMRFAGDMYYDFLFFVDCGVALVGYCLESQWLKNKTRSVEPTALGWAAALSCYPPFNDVLGTYLPLEGHQFITDESWKMVCRGLMLAAFTVYAAATVAFGFKFSNLTNRGITDKGPYRFIRHPAYVCKGFAWWMEWLPNMSLQTAFFLTGLNLVYALRAWTEERHLSQDPDYVAYKKKVPWVMIPGVW